MSHDHGEVETVRTKEQLRRILGEESRLVVIKFTASWCGPCQKISPVFVDYSKNFRNVKFVEIDVDDSSELAEEYGVNCMPTFVFVKNGTPLSDRIQGADRSMLQKKLEAYQ
eukprot:gene5097-5601_t